MISTEDWVIRDGGPWMQGRTNRSIGDEKWESSSASRCINRKHSGERGFSLLPWQSFPWLLSCGFSKSSFAILMGKLNCCILHSKYWSRLKKKFAVGISKCSHEYFKFLNVMGGSIWNLLVFHPLSLSISPHPRHSNCVYMGIWERKVCSTRLL